MIKTKLVLIIITVTFTLFGCSSKPKKVDTTPQNPTVVLDAEYVINGYILPDSRGKQTVYTRGDRRRIDQTIEYDSWASRTFFGNGQISDIARLDRNLLWKIDRKEKTYVECAIKGCSKNILSMLGDPNTKGDETPESMSEMPACETEMKVHDFSVKPTGDKRELNGFAVEKYDVNWRMEFADKQKRKDKSNLHMELWTTTPTAQMKNTWKTNEQFQHQYLQSTGMNNNPLGRFVGQEIYMALAAFTGDTSKNKTWNTKADKEMAKIKGYPISIKMELYSISKACPEPKEKKKEAKFDVKDPLGSAKDVIGGFFSKKVDEQMARDESKPIFRYIYEVKEVQSNPEHDSRFMIPEDYKMMDRS